MSLLSRLTVLALPWIPLFVVRAVSRPYIAGETLEEALAVAATLNRKGFRTTLDILGEHTTDTGDATTAAREYGRVLAALGDHGIDGNISVKPTQFGLNIDFELCRNLFSKLIEDAASRGYFVRVEMEDSGCTESTVQLYESLLRQYDNVGIVIQAYLHRSRSDAERLARFRPNVRMVKGVYVEPSSIAFQDPERIRDSYLAISETFLRAGSYVAFATHDDTLIERASELVDGLGLSHSEYEFQMLLGVQERLRNQILEAGRTMRVYIPFGTDWYPYSLRRLRENPRIAGYVLRALVWRS